MAAAVLLRSVARKMSRAAAPTHHLSLVERGLQGGARSGPANSNQVQVQQGTADVLVSAGMAASSGLRSGAGRLTTKMAHAPPPPPTPPQYHRLVHGRGIHNNTSPDPSPSTREKVLDALRMGNKVAAAVAFVGAIGCAIYMHFCVKPELMKLSAMMEMMEVLREKGMDSQDMDASSVSHQTPTAPASGEGKKHL